MQMDDLPVFKKCCFCVPLRYGLLIWGYLKLGTALLVLSFYILIVAALYRFIVRDVTLITIISLVAVLLVSEIILHLIFIIGAHQKNVRLLKAYYYYAKFMFLMTIIMFLVSTGFLIFSLIQIYHGLRENALLIVIVVCFIFAIVVQTFLILSIRSEIIKLRSNCPYRFVKDENDPEGTINSVKAEEEMSVYNGTVRIL